MSLIRADGYDYGSKLGPASSNSAPLRASVTVVGPKPGPVFCYFMTGRSLGPAAVKTGPKQGQSFITGPDIGPAGTSLYVQAYQAHNIFEKKLAREIDKRKTPN